MAPLPTLGEAHERAQAREWLVRRRTFTDPGFESTSRATQGMLSTRESYGSRTERGVQEPRRSFRGYLLLPYGRRSWRLRDGATEIEETDS